MFTTYINTLPFLFVSFQVAFSGIQPRALNRHKPWLPTAQQAHCLQQINDVASIVNNTLVALADKIPHLHFVPHPLFPYADVLDFEQSPECCLIARDGHHLSYKECQMVCKNILQAVTLISDSPSTTPSTPPPPSVPSTLPPSSRPSTPPSPIPSPASCPHPLQSSIWDLPIDVTVPDKPILYSDVVCIIAKDQPAVEPLVQESIEVPDMLCYTTFPPLPSSP